MEFPLISRSQPVTVSASQLVRSHKPDGYLPLVIEPTTSSVDLCGWAMAHRDSLERDLLTHGALLFRGFDLAEADDLDRVIRTVSDGPLEYQERSSPRQQVRGNIYTSTEYAADQTIFFHNENSYQLTWPMKLFFLCETPAARGGATPLASNREITQRIPAAIRRRFEELGVRYVRTYSSRLGLSWQHVFQTEDSTEVESYCAGHHLTVEWLRDGRLRTTHRGAAVVPHPLTGEPLWFNHGAFFHVTTLPKLVQERLRAELPEEELPQNTYYGDGSRIDDAVIEEIRQAYRASARSFDWQCGDLLMLDNMLVAHARDPFSGTRKILVGMAQPHHDARL